VTKDLNQYLTGKTSELNRSGLYAYSWRIALRGHSPMIGKKILFICGSLNQTTINTQVAAHLKEHECWFTPFYGDGLVGAMAGAGMLESSILGRKARERSAGFLRQSGYRVDDGGVSGDYDLVVTCTDLFIPRNIRGKKTVLIQEGMTIPENSLYHLVKAFRLPGYLANTSMMGLSGAYQAFCVASGGFREMFVRKGVDQGKIRVTGVPNFDHVDSYRDNDFPHRHHVLVATSHLRESGKYENRKRLIRKALDIAEGRPVLFKLHPMENKGRAEREIQKYAPGYPIYSDGNTNHMVANCDALVTRYSSVALVAAALGKEVHSDFDPGFLERVKPLQNGGSAGRRIAQVCREVMG